jgi:hypothetical protein
VFIYLINSFFKCIMNFSIEELSIIALLLDQDEKKEKRRHCIHPIWKFRDTDGEFATLYRELVDHEFKLTKIHWSRMSVKNKKYRRRRIFIFITDQCLTSTVNAGASLRRTRLNTHCLSRFITAVLNHRVVIQFWVANNFKWVG